MSLDGFVEPKERARTSRSGHHYTPKDTRDYESYVKTNAIATMRDRGLKVFDRPVIIYLEIRDQIHSETQPWLRTLMKNKLVFETTGGDLDNKEKAILDALNKVVYKDDRLVVQCFKFRTYADVAGFTIDVTPCGLTKTDLENIGKILTYGGYDGQEKNTRGSAR